MTDLRMTLTAIQAQAPGFVPWLGLVLGSGLGEVAGAIADPIVIPYSDIPGFGVSSVSGHGNRLLLGTLNQIPVACLQGRTHRYEGESDLYIRIMIRTLKQLGCQELLLTNAAGSLHTRMAPSQLMLITDHINLQAGNPLIGPNDETIGPRFFPLDPAYDPSIRARLKNAAQELGIHLDEGVYLAVQGPNYETPAEIRAFRILGADAVGMSTVPEVLVANHCGLKVAAISSITNLASGLSEQAANHEEVLHHGAIAAKNLTRLILAYAKNTGKN